jgi:S-adenosylmethionine hydrolase
LRRVAVFDDLMVGEPGVLVDANGRLALVMREGSAAASLGVGTGDLVELTW